jgi:hypothetical protein
MFVTGIKARINSGIASDSKLAYCTDDGVYSLLSQMNSALFYYNDTSTGPHRVTAIKLMREYAKQFTESSEFTVYDEKLANAIQNNLIGVTLVTNLYNYTLTWQINSMTLKEAKNIVDSYYGAIIQYADDSNKVSDSYKI